MTTKYWNVLKQRFLEDSNGRPADGGTYNSAVCGLRSAVCDLSSEVALRPPSSVLRPPTSVLCPPSSVLRSLSSVLVIAALLGATQTLSGCQDSGPIDVATADRVPVDLDKSNEERLLRYYLGGYVSAEGGDPVEAGLMMVDGGLALNPQHLDPAFRTALTDADGNGTIGWEEFVEFVEATYADARLFPHTLAELKSTVQWSDDDSVWFTLDVDGVVTVARRRIYVPLEAIRTALAGYSDAGERIVYAPGTVIVAEHLDDERVLETTVKRRRSDGFWDFAIYDASGRRALRTSTGPRELRAPVQCVGCHLGRRAFDPEKSFPAEAPDGPYGPRALYVSDDLRNAEVTAYFDEHAKRSDGLLGLYATLYTARLVADREEGILSEENRTLLESFGL